MPNVDDLVAELRSAAAESQGQLAVKDVLDSAIATRAGCPLTPRPTPSPAAPATIPPAPAPAAIAAAPTFTG